MITFFDFKILNSKKETLKSYYNNYKLHIMKQITKITFVLALIISLASCQSSKVGCYDFGAIDSKVSENSKTDTQKDFIITSVVSKP